MAWHSNFPGGRASAFAAAMLAFLPFPSAASAQPPPSGAAAPYRAPAIALVQPAAGVGLPQDKPVIVLRFMAGESGDAIAANSFAVSVDGENRTAGFQVTASEAWGPIGHPDREVAVGTHVVAARICSTRGACGELSASVTVVPPSIEKDPGATSRRDRILDLLLSAAKKLLQP